MLAILAAAVATAAAGYAPARGAERRQYFDLAPGDLQKHAVWRFVPGALRRDLVEPYAGPVRAGRGRYLLRAWFTLRDGTKLLGYVRYPPAGKADVPGLRPAIVWVGGHVAFWQDRQKPSADRLFLYYHLLHKDAKRVFPVRYRVDVKTPDGPIAGSIPGFMYREGNRTRQTR
jgi:hypothetical protein